MEGRTIPRRPGGSSKKMECWTDKKNRCHLSEAMHFPHPHCILNIFNSSLLIINTIEVLGACLFLILFKAIFWIISLIILIHSLKLIKQGDQAMRTGPETRPAWLLLQALFPVKLNKVNRVQFSGERVSFAGVVTSDYREGKGLDTLRGIFWFY